MKPVTTTDLLRELIHYNFFDWDDENEEKQNLIVYGMPQNILDDVHISNFYKSWGFDALNNSAAKVEIIEHQWRKLEDYFFEWLSKAENLIFPTNKVIFTPDLETYWTHDLPDWASDCDWIQKQYKEYTTCLEENRIIAPVTLIKNDYRSGKIENFRDLEIIGRMAVKSFPILFLSDYQMVIRLTEYLTLEVFFKDGKQMDIHRQIMDILSPQVLKKAL
ncbi:hypothetical protein SAMN05444392_10890 [Seinonella peptonophila]|uniref:Uncharacterized protein n=1 Tax=Seinonella peptonophila TaxID=112248 RepID=A0A1M4Z8K0_9BACL|nr:hypothetical protein [Seinonella peptonophila]SHF14092.1 hypothetical protein SAMN05444392_10890 [Seinonella peptonophila]